MLGAIHPEFGARLGIAERRFTAYAAALTADPGSVLRIAPGESEAFLAPLPVEWLPLDAEAVERLRLLGLRTCGALAALPRHALEAQFGPSGGRAWLAARGDDTAAPACSGAGARHRARAG